MGIGEAGRLSPSPCYPILAMTPEPPETATSTDTLKNRKVMLFLSALYFALGLAGFPTSRSRPTTLILTSATCLMALAVF